MGKGEPFFRALHTARVSLLPTVSSTASPARFFSGVFSFPCAEFALAWYEKASPRASRLKRGGFPSWTSLLVSLPDGEPRLRAESFPFLEKKGGKSVVKSFLISPPLLGGLVAL